jgi:hypothetical protein
MCALECSRTSVRRRPLKTVGGTLAVLLIGALAAQELAAQGGGPAPAPPLQSDDLSAGSTPQCRYPASAVCRRKPRASSNSNGVGYGAAAAGPLLRVHGDATAVRLDARQVTVAQALDALAASFNISYRTSTALDEVLSGTYVGPLGHVIARILDGYNYAIRRENGEVEVMIFGRQGQQSVFSPPSPARVTPVRPLRERPRPGLLGKPPPPDLRP